jgi:hypothetical protein
VSFQFSVFSFPRAVGVEFGVGEEGEADEDHEEGEELAFGEAEDGL